MSKSPFTPELREMVSKLFLDGKSSIELSKKYGVAAYTVRKWALRYKEQGIEAFANHVGNKAYSLEFKQQCVELYLSGTLSIDEIVAKYCISANQVLWNWIKCYNETNLLKDYFPNREVYMAEARRKTTFEERKEIVKYCLSHERDYKGTASLYDVSYSQVYSWVRKYDATGEEGLSDKRGRHKTDGEVDELERLRRENKRLKRQLEENDMLVQLLKKVKEFEGM